MGHKAVETTCNINNALGSGTARNIQYSGGSGSFARETRALRLASHPKLTKTN